MQEVKNGPSKRSMLLEYRSAKANRALTRLALCVTLAAVASLQPREAWAQKDQAAPATRPFPVVQIQVGDVPVLLPKDWVEAKFLTIARERDWFSFANANDRKSPRSTHFEVPPLNSFRMTGGSRGRVEPQLYLQKVALERLTDEPPDSDGFRRNTRKEYILLNTTRPFGQALIVGCTPSLRLFSRKNAGFEVDPNERHCHAYFSWTANTSVRYYFYDTDIPKARWAELDRHVLALVSFLDGRKEWAGGN